MKPNDSPKQAANQERERAEKLAQLYPQPTEYSRSFTRSPQAAATPDLVVHNDINLVVACLTGAATSLPFIAFEIGRSTLVRTTNTTEAAQLGMLALLYLVFFVGLLLLTYKLFIKKNQVTTISPSFAYWSILLFSVPSALIVKPLLLSDSPTLLVTIIYYIASIGIFTLASLFLAKLDRQSPTTDRQSRKALLTFLAVPYVIGAVSAIIGMF